MLPLPTFPKFPDFLVYATACLALVSLGLNAHAAWPDDKAITLVVPYTAGGSVDTNARLIAGKLSDRLGQSVVVENVAGAGGAIGAARVAGATPDGYTLVVGPDSVMVIGKLVNPQAFRFDPLTDLTPVVHVDSAPMVLVASPELPVDTWQDFVKLARANPQTYSYATSGVGTTLHLAMEQIKQRENLDIAHVPYRGGAQMVTDVSGNHIHLAMLIGTTAIPQVQGRRVKALGVTDDKRLAVLPDVPAFGEMPSLAGFSMLSWTGIFAPAGTPAAIVQRLNAELRAVLADPEVQSNMRERGVLPGTGSPQAFGQFIQREFVRNQKILETIAIDAGS